MGLFSQKLTTKTVLSTLLVIELSLTSMMVMGEVYKVGDSHGWAANSKTNYSSWASSKTFHVNDVLLFVYNATNDNVIEVNHLDFRSCNTSAPMKVFNSGNDSFTIKAPGHYFFTSKISDHCKAGQKLDIRVLKLSPPQPSIAISPSPSGVAHVESNAIAPSPTESNAATTHDPKWLLMKTIGVALSGLVIFVSAYA